MTHTVQISDFVVGETSTILASASSINRRKQLLLVSNILEDGTVSSKFKVFHDQDELLETAFLDKAIEMYNSIQ